jgi:hypothetical protein
MAYTGKVTSPESLGRILQQARLLSRAAPLPIAAIAAFAGTRGRRRRDTISLPQSHDTID